MVCTLDYINNWLKANLDSERYEHSLGTAQKAEELAEIYGEDKEKAYFAGLIHDCAKCLPKNEMAEIISKIELECGEADSPKTHHAPAGVYVAKKEFGVEDEEILSAIRWHTIGKIGMTNFEKIIYIADKIEERTRPAEYAAPIREALKEENGLDKALFASYSNTIKSLVDRKLRICTQTIDLYNALLDS